MTNTACFKPPFLKIKRRKDVKQAVFEERINNSSCFPLLYIGNGCCTT